MEGKRGAAWRRVAERAGMWRQLLGVSEWMEGVLRNGIRDLPTSVDKETGMMAEIPQSAEDLQFGREELEKRIGEAE